jgi:hypothetical protein
MTWLRSYESVLETQSQRPSWSVVSAHSRAELGSRPADGFSRARLISELPLTMPTFSSMPGSSSNNGTGWHLCLNSLFAGCGA